MLLYNSRNPAMLSPHSRRAAWVLFVCLLSQLSAAADWHDLSNQLAGKIAAATGPGVIALDVNNRSSITPAEVEQIRSQVASALATAGIKIWQPDQAAATIHVTLSESLQNYVWVAEVQQAANEHSLIIVSAPRPDSGTAAQNSMPLTLHSTVLLSQPEPMLDVAVIEGNPRRLVVLGRDAVTINEFRSNRWVADPPLAIQHQHPLPRDARGRIFLRSDHLFDAYLPGLICHSTNSSPLAMTCAANDDPWPLESGLSAFYAPNRNFFTGALVPGIGQQKSAPAFYSAAAVPREKYVLWLFAGIDGQLNLLDGINRQVAPKIQWGSEIAAMHSPCRSGSQVLATSTSESGADSIQAFEFPDREPVAASNKLELSGNVTALWSAQNETAVAVVHNNETGNYEAMLLNLACNQ